MSRRCRLTADEIETIKNGFILGRRTSEVARDVKCKQGTVSGYYKTFRKNGVIKDESTRTIIREGDNVIKLCRICKKWLSINNFQKTGRGVMGVRHECKECVSFYDKSRRHITRPQERARRKRATEARLVDRNCKICEKQFKPSQNNHIYCSQRCARLNRLYDEKTRRKKLERIYRCDAGLCVSCGCSKQIKNKRCEDCLEILRARERKKHRETRIKAISLYGDRCVCCGESELDFLAIDHINNDGSIQRKKDGKSGRNYYMNVIKRRPSDLQILCHNCNLAKAFYGICPHQRTKPQLVCEGV